MAKADDYCGARSCNCRADEYDPSYWDYVKKNSNSNQDDNKTTTNNGNVIHSE